MTQRLLSEERTPDTHRWETSKLTECTNLPCEGKQEKWNQHKQYLGYTWWQRQYGIHAVRVPRDKMGNRIYMRRRHGGRRSRDTVKKPRNSLLAIGTGEEVDKRDKGRWRRESRKLGFSEVSLFINRHGVTYQVFQNPSCVACQMLTADIRFTRNVGTYLRNYSVAFTEDMHLHTKGCWMNNSYSEIWTASRQNVAPSSSSAVFLHTIEAALQVHEHL